MGQIRLRNPLYGLTSAEQMTHKPPQTQLARSTFEILNDLMGEIHAARVIGYLALKQPQIFQTKHPKYFLRLGIGGIMIVLYKLDDLWRHQITNLLTHELPDEGRRLIADLQKKKVRQFRSLFIAHYSDRPRSPRPPLSKLESLLRAQGFKNDEELFLWTNEIVEILGLIRNALQTKFKIEL